MADSDERPTETETDDAASERSESDPSRVGPYQILKKLGQGGMGEVFLAEQQEPIRRRVALKTIKWGMDTRAVIARFEAERQALALMDHPSVAKVLDAGATETGRPYFVMEYVKGVPITAHCDRHRLTIDERLELFIRVCEGVQHAHRNGIIHRDIKPHNVLVTIQEDLAVPKIIDFGVAKAVQHRLTERTLFTELGQIVGTPEYMSPEQAEMTGQGIDTRTDVYSLGVLLYELLVGALPHDKGQLRVAGFDEMRRMIREDEVPKPSARVTGLGAALGASAEKRRTDTRGLRRRVRGDLDWIVMKALEKDRMRRYASPRELAADIRRHLSDEPVVAGPPSITYRLTKLFHRRRSAMLTAAFVALVIAVAGAIVFQRGWLSPEASSAARIESLVVLPFTNVADDSEQEYFVDGMTEAMINTLGRIGGLRVTGRRSSMYYKGADVPLSKIAQDLEVDAILDGSVLHLVPEGRVRIDAELIDARTNERLWTNSFEREVEDVLALQGDVATAIARQVRLTLTPRESSLLQPTRRVNPQAHDLFLQGKALLDRGMWPRSLEFFRRAVEIDDRSAEAHAGISRALGLLMGHTDDYPRAATEPKIRAAAQKALELDETLELAQTYWGFTLLWLEWDWTAAEQAFLRALELNPSSAEARRAYSWCLFLTDRPEQALRESERARQIERASAEFMMHHALLLYFARRYDEALELLDSVSAFEPDMLVAKLLVGRIYAQQGKLEQAVERYEQVRPLLPSMATPDKAGFGYVYALAGRTPEASRILEELEAESRVRQVDAYYLAIITQGLGDADGAFALLERAYEQRNVRLILLKLDPLWDSLRPDPRYDDLLARIGPS